MGLNWESGWRKVCSQLEARESVRLLTQSQKTRQGRWWRLTPGKLWARQVMKRVLETEWTGCLWKPGAWMKFLEQECFPE